MTNSYTNYSMEELISMKENIEKAIDEKKRKAYDEALEKVLEALEIMKTNYPYDEAIDFADGNYITWEELYRHIHELF